MDDDIYYIDEDARLMDGYDDCILGVCERFGQEPLIAYDFEKVISKLQTDGLSYDDAVEWFYYNQIGAWVGDRTPVFIFRQDIMLPSDDGDETIIEVIK